MGSYCALADCILAYEQDIHCVIISATVRDAECTSTAVVAAHPVTRHVGSKGGTAGI